MASSACAVSSSSRAVAWAAFALAAANFAAGLGVAEGRGATTGLVGLPLCASWVATPNAAKPPVAAATASSAMQQRLKPPTRSAGAPSASACGTEA
jgi:hypothetical protein